MGMYVDNKLKEDPEVEFIRDPLLYTFKPNKVILKSQSKDLWEYYGRLGGGLAQYSVPIYPGGVSRSSFFEFLELLTAFKGVSISGHYSSVFGSIYKEYFVLGNNKSTTYLRVEYAPLSNFNPPEYKGSFFRFEEMYFSNRNYLYSRSFVLPRKLVFN